MRIGLIGPSCSGKSTLSRMLADRIGARHLTLDEYYLRGHERRYVQVGDRSIRSFEHPAAYDGDALLRDVQATDGDVVAEGFLLLAYPYLVAALDVKIFVDLDWSEIRRRRALRTGQTTGAVDESFDLIGESEWLAFGAGQAFLPDVVRLDGTEPPEVLLDRVLGLLGPAYRAA